MSPAPRPTRLFRRLAVIALAVLTTTFGLVGIATAGAATASAPAPKQVRPGTAATFTHFRVTVGNIVRTPSQGLLVHASVCVRSLPPGSTGGKTRISWQPWTLVTNTGTFRPHLYDGSHPPRPLFAESTA